MATIWKVVRKEDGKIVSVIATGKWQKEYHVWKQETSNLPMFAFDNEADAIVFAEEFMEPGDVVVFRATTSAIEKPPAAVPFSMNNDEAWDMFWNNRAAWERRYPYKNIFIPHGTVWVRDVTLIERVY